MKAIWDTYVYQMNAWEKGTPVTQLLKRTKAKLKSSYGSYLWQEINQLPYHIHTLRYFNPYKDRRHVILEREKSVMQTYRSNRKRLKKKEIDAFEAHWVHTGLVTIIKEDQQPTSLQIGPVQINL